MGGQVGEEFLRCCPPEFSRRYQLIRRLGKGTTSLVYQAHQDEFDRDVVVKIFHHEEPELHERFMREGELLARLNHPAIMQILDFGAHGDFLYIVAKYIPGKTLKEMLAKGPVEWQRLVDMFKVITDALAVVHVQGIIHRDLKPANILITGSGAPVILDFGFARATDTRNLTRTGFYIGTPSYGAPEALLENRYDVRTDLYAIGVMMYELLIGRNPFYDSNLQLVVAHHVERRFHELPPLPEDVPAPLVDLLERLLEKEPARRPASAKEVNVVLKRLSLKKGGTAAMAAYERSGTMPVPRLTVAIPAVVESPRSPVTGSQTSPWMVVFAISGILSGVLLAIELNGMMPEIPMISLDPPSLGPASTPARGAGPTLSDTEREAMFTVLRDISLRAQERQETRQGILTLSLATPDVEGFARRQLAAGQQDMLILRRLDEDVRARIPVEALTREDRCLVAWVRTLRFVTTVDLRDFKQGLDRPLLNASRNVSASAPLGMEDLKIFADCLDSMAEVLDPASFTATTPPWMFSYVSMCFMVAQGAQTGWESSLISLRNSRMDAFDKKLDAWSWDRGPGSALARLSWLAWRRGGSPISEKDQVAHRRMAAEAIAELRRHPACTPDQIRNLETFLFPL